MRKSRKWPRGPRFTVGAVTGITINPSAISMGAYSRPLPLIWYVYDAAYCYRIMGEYHWQGERRAREAAAKLNAEYEQ